MREGAVRLGASVAEAARHLRLRDVGYRRNNHRLDDRLHEKISSFARVGEWTGQLGASRIIFAEINTFESRVKFADEYVKSQQQKAKKLAKSKSLPIWMYK